MSKAAGYILSRLFRNCIAMFTQNKLSFVLPRLTMRNELRKSITGGNCKTGCSKGVSPLFSTLGKTVDGLATTCFEIASRESKKGTEETKGLRD